MSDLQLLVGSVEFGNYISVFKFVIFAALFFGFIPVVNWIHDDSNELGLGSDSWTGLVLGALAVASVLFMFIPFFIAAVLIFIIILVAISLIYVKHRNSRVMEFDKVLTAEHIKTLLSKKNQEKEDKAFTFITANKNEVPVPEPKTPEFHGYRAAYEILDNALKKRATKISLTPSGEQYNLNFTIDEVDTPQPSVDKERAEYFVNFIKSAADLNLEDKRKPQKGKFKIKASGEKFDWQVTTAGSSSGQQAALKDVTEYEIKKASELGFSDEQLEKLKTLQEKSNGVFLVTGPAKSGVTTTVYGLLREHDAFLNSIDSLERKPIGDIPNVNQFKYSMSDTGTTTYAKKLRSIIRMGPDITAVMDCKDAETAQLTCQAAAKSMLLYLNFESSSIAKGIAQWLKFVGDKNQAIDNLIGISNQRLIRNLCEECKQGYSPNRELLRKFNLPPEKAKVLYKPGKVIYDKRDREMTCPHCQGSGFYGVEALFELLVLDDKTKQTLKKVKKVKDINNVLRSSNVVALQQQALRKVLRGETSINEMIRVIQNKKEHGS
jgi:general secretion pathway protein E